MAVQTIPERLRRRARRFAARSAARLYLAAHFSSGSAARERSAARRGIPILNLHRVSELNPRHPMTMVPSDFRRLLAGLQHAYRFIRLSDLDRILNSGQNRDDLACLTFDDCYGCNHTYAVPILRELGIPATFFVSTRFIDSSEPFPHDVANGYRDLPNFTSAQLREMAASPDLEIGSHSVSHFNFSKSFSDEELKTELMGSKAALEKIVGRPVARFAVPWGGIPHCSTRVIQGAKDAGYERVYSHFGGRNLVHPGRMGYVLHRICSQGEPAYVRACLEGYSGRNTVIPGGSDRSRWPAEFHPTDIRWV
jgi:peptidoglycan/xylan/chitin deacetylase (PgdA/CDA1 family)